MEQEQKDILLKDLCARLPYGVILNCCNIVSETLTLLDYKGLVNNDYDIDEVKPHLFPLSSMTEEQKNDLTKNLHSNVFVKDEISFWDLSTANIIGEWEKVFEWCHKNHFDIYGLIPMNLAIDATGKNIY